MSGTNSASFSRTQTAVVSVMNVEAYVNTDVTEISKSGQEITSMLKCHVNEQLRENPHHDNSIVTNEAHGYGKAPSFRVNFGGDRYTISFRTPQVTGTRDQTRDLSPAACGPSYVPKPVNGPYTLGGGSYTASGNGKPTDLALSGNETKTGQLTDGTRTVNIEGDSLTRLAIILAMLGHLADPGFGR